MSDLHFRGSARLGRLPAIPDADLAVVAGDVMDGRVEVTIDLLSNWIGERMPVLFVLGNHDFYGSSIDETLSAARQASKSTAVTLLADETVEIGGVRFCGSTLWTDYELYADGDRQRHAAYMMAAGRGLLDHYEIGRIPGSPDRFTPSEARIIHQRSRAYIGRVLLQPFEGPTVVVTHHAPHPLSVAERFVGDSLTPAFVSDLSDILARGRPHLWIHGHVHNSVDYQVGGTRILCNPHGYGTENPAFEPALVVEVA